VSVLVERLREEQAYLTAKGIDNALPIRIQEVEAMEARETRLRDTINSLCDELEQCVCGDPLEERDSERKQDRIQELVRQARVIASAP